MTLRQNHQSKLIRNLSESFMENRQSPAQLGQKFQSAKKEELMMRKRSESTHQKFDQVQAFKKQRKTTTKLNKDLSLVEQLHGTKNVMIYEEDSAKKSIFETPISQQVVEFQPDDDSKSATKTLTNNHNNTGNLNSQNANINGLRKFLSHQPNDSIISENVDIQLQESKPISLDQTIQQPQLAQKSDIHDKYFLNQGKPQSNSNQVLNSFKQEGAAFKEKNNIPLYQLLDQSQKNDKRYRNEREHTDDADEIDSNEERIDTYLSQDRIMIAQNAHKGVMMDEDQDESVVIEEDVYKNYFTINQLPMAKGAGDSDKKNTVPPTEEDGSLSLNTFVIHQDDLMNGNKSYQLALGFQDSNFTTPNNKFQDQKSEFEETQDFPKLLASSQNSKEQVYNRLYLHAKSLQFKKEFQTHAQEYLDKHKIDLQNKSNSKQRQSLNPNYKDPETRNTNTSTRSSSLKQLYEDHQRRQVKNNKLLEDLNKQIKFDQNKTKSNKNSHTLALQKLEKDLFSILKRMSEKTFQSDSQLTTKNNSTIYQFSKANEQKLEQKVQRKYQDILNQREIFLTKRQMQEFFIVTGIFKYSKDEIPDNLNNKQLEKMNEEITFLETVWIIINQKFNPDLMQLADQVELEFTLQFFKIIFDPYSSVDQQVQLINQLRNIIKVILEKQEFQVSDRLSDLFSNSIEQKQQINFLVQKFRSLNSNFYNISHLSSLKYQSSRSRSRSDNKQKARYSQIQDEQQCTFQPIINKKSAKLDPFTKEAATLIQLQQQEERCNSEVVEEEEDELSPSSKNDSKRIINILNASITQKGIQNLQQSQRDQTQAKLEKHQVFSYQQEDENDQAYQDQRSQKPPIPVSSRNSSSRINRHMILYQHGKVQEAQYRQFSEEIRKRQINQFSYQPKINDKSRIMIGYEENQGSIYERLYRQKDVREMKQQEINRISEKIKIEQIQETCPFVPAIKQVPIFVKIDRKEVGFDKEKVSQDKPKGFDLMVKRMNDGRVLKAKKLADFMNLGQVKNYTGLSTVHEPFDLKTSQRADQRQNRHKNPLIIIEIIIAPGKAAQIPIYPNDDPEVLCENFSKTYNLGKAARQSLLQILRSHLQQKQNHHYLTENEDYLSSPDRADSQILGSRGNQISSSKRGGYGLVNNGDNQITEISEHESESGTIGSRKKRDKENIQ